MGVSIIYSNVRKIGAFLASWHTVLGTPCSKAALLALFAVYCASEHIGLKYVNVLLAYLISTCVTSNAMLTSLKGWRNRESSRVPWHSRNRRMLLSLRVGAAVSALCDAARSVSTIPAISATVARHISNFRRNHRPPTFCRLYATCTLSKATYLRITTYPQHHAGVDSAAEPLMH